jgi:hypothetical protein
MFQFCVLGRGKRGLPLGAQPALARVEGDYPEQGASGILAMVCGIRNEFQMMPRKTAGYDYMGPK